MLEKYYFFKFLRSYLYGREQRFTIENFCSTSKGVLSGAPQGSLLGPILFVLVISDLPQGIDPSINLALHADDNKFGEKLGIF